MMNILRHADDIVLDIHERYHVDLHREPVSWHWLVARIGGLLTAPITRWDHEGRPVPVTRLQRALWRR